MIDDQFVEALLSAPDAQVRHALMHEHGELMRVENVYALKERADRLERDDPHQALKIGVLAEEVADCLNNNEGRALALWAQANGHNHLSELDSAVRCYQRAAEFFQLAGKPLEAARTSIGEMFTLIKLGQFDRAQELAEEARRVFVEQGDVASQAKIDMNLGVSHEKQGQYSLALGDYRRAAEAFQFLKNPLYVAMNEINQANMLNELDEFAEARKLHELARPVFDAAGLQAAVASVDHDLAVIHYASGNYAEAFRTYERARDAFTNIADQGNLAQADLEESDVYLHLNLPDEALRLAERAEVAFAQTGMIFELARCRVNRAVALARMGQAQRAIDILGQAREMFVSQGNETWTAQIDLQLAEVIGQDGQRERARRLADHAARAYKKLGMKTKQAYALILCANLWADDQDYNRALKQLKAARSALDGLAAPWLERRIETCLGRIHEMLGDRALAIEHYGSAARQIEQMTAALAAEEHRTAFVADKLAPYEALVTLYAPEDPGMAFQWAEQAKSRALVDLLAAGVRPRLRIQDEMDARRVARLQALREELNWLYTRLTRGAATGEPGALAAGQETWIKIEEREREATSLWRDLQGRHAEQLSLIRMAPLRPADLQANLPPGTALLEYFIARGQVTAFLITHDDVRAYPNIAALAELQLCLGNLAFQFSKFQYGQAYYQRHRATLLGGTNEILGELGEKLFSPLSKDLRGLDALIIVPHGPLHALPFQALRVADRYLIEDYAISYAPSAAVLKFCWDKLASSKTPLPFSGNALLVGVPDERASHVRDEIRALVGLLPDAKVLLGEAAGFEQVCQSAPAAGIVHLAAHGLFRPEAPLLSSIHLADRWLAVQDIYDLDLHASLVTLSACETGLGHDAGGDDLMGLVRGFLYAGAASIIVSLWTVDDESMTHLIVDFYTHWLAGKPKAQALRQAQLDLLEKYEHPFYWAPLVLVGNEN